MRLNKPNYGYKSYHSAINGVANYIQNEERFRLKNNEGGKFFSKLADLLLWAKEKIFSFHEFFINNYYIGNEIKNFYICLKWADSKRRNVYSRLIKYGFYFMYDEGEKILMKKI